MSRRVVNHNGARALANGAARSRAPKAVKPVVAPAAGDLMALVTRISRSRDNMNPLRGLSMSRAVTLLEAYVRGEFSELMWLYGNPVLGLETIDADLSALITRWNGAIKKLTWNVKIVDDETRGFDEKLADDQAERLRETYEAIDNVNGAIEHFVLARFRGFSVVEKHVNADGDIFHLELVDHWNMVRDGSRGRWKYNPEATIGANFHSISGEALPEEQFVIREFSRPLNPLALVKYVRATNLEKFWDFYAEVSGLPSGVVIMPPDVRTEDVEEFRASAKRIAEGGTGSLPHGSDYKANPAQKSDQPFKARLDHLSEKLVLAGTCGKLTMLASPTGIGSGASQEHADVFDDLARGEAADISALFQKSIDLPLLLTEFPGKPVLAYWELAANEETDTSAFVTDVKTLADAGYQVAPDQVEEKTGYDVELKSAALPPEPNVPGGELQDGPNSPHETKGQAAAEAAKNRAAQDSELLRAAIAEALGVVPEWLAPVGKKIASIERAAAAENVSDADFLALLESIQTELPELAASMDFQAFADAITAATGTATLAGVVHTLRKTKAAK